MHMHWIMRLLAAALLIATGATQVDAAMRTPSALSAVAYSSSRIVVGWNDSNAQVTGFIVERSLKQTSGYKIIATLNGGSLRSYNDGGLAAATRYYYRIRAVSGSTKSTRSTVASATTLSNDTTPPLAPSGFAAVPVTCSRIDLMWSPATDATSGMRGYKLYRNGAFLREVASTGTTDAGLTASTAYTYELSAVDNAANESARSRVAASTSACAPVATVTAFVAATATPVPTTTPIRTATAHPSATTTPVATSTAIRTATVVPTSTATRTATPVPTATGTAVPTTTATVTAVPTVTATTTVTAVPTSTTTPVRTATAVPTSTRTATPVPTSTRTATPVPTSTPNSGDGPWAKRFGGTGSDAARAVAIDGRGDVVVTGSFTGITNFGGGSLSTAGASDVVLAKYTAAGSHVWSKRMGSIGLDQAFGVAVDRSADCDGAGGTDCVVVAGTFNYTVDFDPGAGTAELTTAGAGDVFVAKYASDGRYLWAKRFGAASIATSDALGGVAVDPSANCDGAGGTGCVLFIGSFLDRADFDGLMLAGPAGVMTPFVAKYSSTGARVWARTFANNNEAFGRAIAVGVDGKVAITGSFKGSMNFGNGTKSSFGGDDVFLAVLRGADGSGIWSSRHGSDGQDVGYGITLDRAGNVALTGSFSSSNGGIGFGGATWYAAGTDIFVASLDANGAHRWSRRCTGTYTALRQGTSVAADDDGNVLLAGHFYGSLNCGTDTPTLTGAGYADILVAKFGSTGAPLWMDRYGRMGCADSGTAIAVDPSGEQVVGAGIFQGQVDIEGTVLPSAGFDDVFVTRLLP